MSDSQVDRERQLNCLLADFASIKTEIARRSTLQRVVLVAYLAILAVVFRQAAEYALTSLWVVGIWTSAVLAFQFSARESLEISRLGRIISKKIAPVVAKLTNAPQKELFPSQTDPESTDTRDRRRRSAYHRQFKWAVFFIIPLLVTVLFTVDCWDRLARLGQITTLTPWAALFVAGLMLRLVVLLKREA